MAFLPKIPVIPRLRLPKLPTINAFIPSVSLPVLSIAARGKLICGLIAQALSPIQKVFQALSGLQNLSSGDISNKVKSTFNSAKNAIKNQVNGVVNSALAQVTGLVKSLVGVPQTVIEAFNNASNALKKQGKDIKKIITDEIDCVTDSISSAVTVTGITSTIEKQTNKSFNKLTNNEQKQLLEDPVLKEQYVDSIVDTVIDNSAKDVTNMISSGYGGQVVAMTKLQNLA